MTVATTVELAWWALCWATGAAPLPYLFTSVAFAFIALAVAMALRLALRRPFGQCPLPTLVLGAVLVGIAASVFLPLKVAIPHQVPFWLDRPLATAERTLFSADPWLLLDRLFGWAAVPIDRAYSLWLPLQSVILFTVMLEAPSPAKSRALIAYSLAWLVLGVAAAVIFSSAGPLFYDRLLGGSDFAGLHATLVERGAWAALSASDAMWASRASNHPGLVAGISAAPSMHVAISFWIYLTARTMAPRAAPFALAYVAFIWSASVQLGWHYTADGLVGILGMLALWAVAIPLDRALADPGRRRRSVDLHQPEPSEI